MAVTVVVLFLSCAGDAPSEDDPPVEATYAPLVLPPDATRVGYWNFDTQSAGANDVSGQGNHGTISNATWTAEGLSAGALYFNGTNAMVAVPDGSWNTGAPATYNLWYKSSGSPTGMLLSHAFGRAPGAFRLDPTGNQTIAAYDGSVTHRAVGFSPEPPGVWVMMTAVFEPTQITLYKNGVFAGTVAAAGMPRLAGPLHFGARILGDQSFKGWIDEVAAYRRALSAAEVQALRAAYPAPPGDSSPLIGQWTFDDPSTTTATDSSGQGNHGAIRNGTWDANGRFGGSMRFNGTDSLVTIPDGRWNNGSPVTYNLWYKSESSAGAWVLEHPFGYPGTFSLFQHRFAARSGTNTGLSTAYSQPPLNTWTMVTVVVGPTAFKLYKDGELQSTTALPGGLPYHAQPLYLGGRGPTYGSDFFRGWIDDVSVFKGELNDAEVRALHRFGSDVVGYWSFDDGSTTVATDSSSRANHGQINNATFTADGLSAGALYFNGTNAIVVIPDGSWNNAAPATYSLWYKSSGSPTGMLLSHAFGRAPGAFRLDPTGNQTIAAYDGSITHRAIGFSPEPPGVWVMMTAVFEPTQITLYKNGVSAGTVAAAGMPRLAGPLHFGARILGDQSFKGWIDEVVVHRRALSAAQVQALHASYPRPPDDGSPLVGRWTFDDPSTTTATDSSGQGTHGTIRNGTWDANGRIGGSMRFNGTDSLVTIPDGRWNNGSPVTYNLWYKSESSAGAWVLEHPFGYPGTFSLFQHRFAARSGTNTGLSTGYSQPPLNTWTMVTVVVEPTTFKLYRDGVLLSTTALPGGLPYRAGPLYMGGPGPTGSGYLRGWIDDVSIYRRALTDAEVLGLFQTSGVASDEALSLDQANHELTLRLNQFAQAKTGERAADVRSAAHQVGSEIERILQLIPRDSAILPTTNLRSLVTALGRVWNAYVTLHAGSIGIRADGTPCGNNVLFNADDVDEPMPISAFFAHIPYLGHEPSMMRAVRNLGQIQVGLRCLRREDVARLDRAVGLEIIHLLSRLAETNKTIAANAFYDASLPVQLLVFDNAKYSTRPFTLQSLNVPADLRRIETDAPEEFHRLRHVNFEQLGAFEGTLLHRLYCHRPPSFSTMGVFGFWLEDKIHAGFLNRARVTDTCRALHRFSDPIALGAGDCSLLEMVSSDFRCQSEETCTTAMPADPRFDVAPGSKRSGLTRFLVGKVEARASNCSAPTNENYGRLDPSTECLVDPFESAQREIHPCFVREPGYTALQPLPENAPLAKCTVIQCDEGDEGCEPTEPPEDEPPAEPQDEVDNCASQANSDAQLQQCGQDVVNRNTDKLKAAVERTFHPADLASDWKARADQVHATPRQVTIRNGIDPDPPERMGVISYRDTATGGSECTSGLGNCTATITIYRESIERDELIIVAREWGYRGTAAEVAAKCAAVATCQAQAQRRANTSVALTVAHEIVHYDLERYRANGVFTDLGKADLDRYSQAWQATLGTCNVGGTFAGCSTTHWVIGVFAQSLRLGGLRDCQLDGPCDESCGDFARYAACFAPLTQQQQDSFLLRTCRPAFDPVDRPIPCAQGCFGLFEPPRLSACSAAAFCPTEASEAWSASVLCACCSTSCPGLPTGPSGGPPDCKGHSCPECCPWCGIDQPAKCPEPMLPSKPLEPCHVCDSAHSGPD